MDIHKIRSLFESSAVLDNNIIIDFIELDCLGLLNNVFSVVEIPLSILENEVPDEHRSKLESELTFTPVSFSDPESFMFFQTVQEKYRLLTDYDTEVVVIAKERSVLCTSNERNVMRACDEFGIRFTGTVGILCCAWEYRLIEEFDTFSFLMRKLFFQCSCWLGEGLKKMVFDHYHIPNRSPEHD